VKHSNYPGCFEDIKSILSSEYNSHSYLLEKNLLTEIERKHFKEVMLETGSDVVYKNSLKNLIEYLYRYHRQKIIVLIDEYDTPIHTGYFEGYYKDIVLFLRGLLGGGLKDNPNIEKAVITGILRISKESLFTGLNNLDVFTLLNQRFGNKMGLTIEEVKEMLQYYELEDKFDELNQWYNGYVFGNQTVFNPWSIINYADKCNEGTKPYWSNTSSNDLIQKLITGGDDEIKNDLEILIKGGMINKPVVEDIVFPEFENRDDILWSFLLFTGYLKAENGQQIKRLFYYDLSIPNQEVVYVYEQVIRGWLNSGYKNQQLELLLKSLVSGNITEFEAMFNDFVIKMMSYYDIGADEPERVYQAFVLGMLVNLSEDYQVKSNRESGYGRYDVMIIPRDTRQKGIVIEFKKLSVLQKESADQALEQALTQIKEKKYAEELRDRGIQEIIELGIVFDGKRIWVRRD